MRQPLQPSGALQADKREIKITRSQSRTSGLGDIVNDGYAARPDLHGNKPAASSVRALHVGRNPFTIPREQAP
jgi:hypothetical protein